MNYLLISHTHIHTHAQTHAYIIIFKETLNFAIYTGNYTVPLTAWSVPNLIPIPAVYLPFILQMQS